ncbi:MAG: flagellar rod assembly protein/muramidase FlgJ [Gammaproteobacteria bacterium RBG_16_57_12]|nr:MAG: flagellar rod assembly protein/muramidase FlgJ [Gammaproteobacteria bacterium RBG_16_57_12]
MTISSTALYNDFGKLAELRHQAAKDGDASLEEVARQFEALFIGMMLKSMRDASLGDALFDSDQGDLYRDMFDQQTALAMASHHGLGLADMMLRQLKGAPASDKAATLRPDHVVQNTPSTNSLVPIIDHAKALPSQPELSSPQQFIEIMQPYAREAAHELGADEKIILAQAALETGWGSKVLRNPDGTSTHNLFNIKAGPDWSGTKVSMAAIEYDDGIAVRRTSYFRSYPDYAASFADYVHHLRSNPRYTLALQEAGVSNRFAVELQRAGFATDPDYSSKINRIATGAITVLLGNE